MRICPGATLNGASHAFDTRAILANKDRNQQLHPGNGLLRCRCSSSNDDDSQLCVLLKVSSSASSSVCVVLRESPG